MALVDYEKGDILLVYLDCRDFHRTPADGFPVRFIKAFEGTEDLSYHGSPWYETFIEVENLKTGKIDTYGNQTYSWVSLSYYLNQIKESRETAINALQFL